MTRLSVILISRNQERNIARLIESVLDETGAFDAEVLLVDSASTDRTVAIASHYPIRVVRLHPGQHLSSHVGRFVGSKHTSGDYALFLDGDMELYPGWLERAVALMERDHQVGAVVGQLIELPPDATEVDKPPLRTYGEVQATPVEHGGGAAMYRRSVLNEVGTFNPYLFSDGEPELCIRIRCAGYRVMQLHHPVVYHYSFPEGKIHTIVGRWRRNLYLGAGQNLRYHLGTKMFWLYFRERGFGCVPLLALAAGCVSLLLAVGFGRHVALRLWLIGLLGALTVDVVRKRSIYRTAASLLQRLFIVDGTIRGFFITPFDPSSYTVKLDVVRE
jgi:glycosyltransferase involved in cell wall biosynthesis